MCDTTQTLTGKTLTSPTISSPGIPDDSVLTLGSTTATAETKITLEFDETTTGIGLVNQGSTSAPMVLNTNPGATVIANTINILHSAGAGDCGDLIAAYKKVAVSGDGDSGVTVVGDALRAYVGTTGGTTVADECYGSQPWAKHEGTGAITAMSAVSALVDVNADNFTASTVNAGHFHIEGAATVTGQFDGIMVEVYPDVTCLDSGIAVVVDSGAVVAAGIRISGSPVCQMLLSSGAKVFTGSAANETAVYAEVGTVDATGSIYISTAGGLYVQVADAGADADWQKVTSTHT
jgi:hypothetical protein